MVGPRVFGVTDQALHFRGIVLPDRTQRTVYIADGRVTHEAVAGSTLVASDVWLVPGLVDAHFVVYPADPLDLAVLRHPSHVVLRGNLFRA